MSNVTPLPLREWRSELRRRGERYVGDELNVATALRSCPDLAELVRFNRFSGHVEFARRAPWRTNMLGERWTDHDDVELTAYLQSHDIDVRGSNVVASVVEMVSHDEDCHPVRQYLESRKWDGEQRLQIWLCEYLNAEGPPDYLAAIGSRFMVSAVARIFEPGCKVDHVLAFEGPQGVGKSEAVRILGKPWSTDSLPDLHSKDAAVHLQGVWLVELAELAALRRTTDVEAAKAFITRPVDRYRPPYGRRSVDVPRQCVFIATTNESQYLRDSTGNRRFWPVKCGRVDFDALERDRDQLWAEAVHLYREGYQWHLTPEETELALHEQAQREVVTELQQQVTEYLDRLESQGITEVAMRRVLTEACGLNADFAQWATDSGRIGPQAAAAMHRHGWQRVGAIGRGADRRVVYRLTGVHTPK